MATMLSGDYGDSYLHDLSLQMVSFYDEPDKYLDTKNQMYDELVSVTKKMYDFMKEFEIYKSNQNSLNELLVSGFDDEQIWQEIQLENNPCFPRFNSYLKKLNANDLSLNRRDFKLEFKPKKIRKIDSASVNDSAVSSMPEKFEDDGEQSSFISEEEEDEKPVEETKKYESTVVDDEFFRLREMEEFLDKQDQLEMDESKQSSGDIDLFNGDDYGERDGFDSVMYKDFFDPPPSKNKRNSAKYLEENGDEDYEMEDASLEELEDNKNGDSEEESEVEEEDDLDEDEEETEEGPKSGFEKKQLQIGQKIKKLEEENLSEKPWQLMGEASSKKRPVNSLLEEFVTFDHTTSGVPEVTEETTLTLEELIKQRIKDQAWDDVVRKEKPILQPYEYKKAPELNQEKSKLSLAEVYEKEYLKQAEGEKEEVVNEEHVEIQKLMDRLFVKLDALSNFHFTPKPPQPELKVITNAPSLQMEEVLPITMTESSQLAPEEVFEKKKGELVGVDEKSEEDRKRERRQKKIKKKFASKEREKKAKLKVSAGKVDKSGKKRAIDSLKKGARNTIVNEKKSVESVKSSNEFFTKLQDQVKKNITKETLKAKNVVKKAKKSAESLKL